MIPEQNQDGKSGENQGITRDNQAASETELINPEIVENYGPWMLAKRRSCNSKHTSTPIDEKDLVNGNSRNEKFQHTRESKKNQATANSRFAALISEDGDSDLPYCSEDLQHAPPSADHPVLTKSIAKRQKKKKEKKKEKKRKKSKL